MIALLMLAWLLIYHGFLLWLSLRFKSKPWRWYWFTTVLVIGFCIAWIDQLYIRYVVIGHYCEVNKDKLGFHEYAPAVVKADQITWVQRGKEGNEGNAKPLTRSEIQRKKFEEDGYQVAISNVVTCMLPESRAPNSCLVSGYSLVEKQKSLGLGRWHFAGTYTRQMYFNNTLVREGTTYAWSGSAFFRQLTGLEIPIAYSGLRCGGDWNDSDGLGSEKNWAILIEE